MRHPFALRAWPEYSLSSSRHADFTPCVPDRFAGIARVQQNVSYGRYAPRSIKPSLLRLRGDDSFRIQAVRDAFHRTAGFSVEPIDPIDDFSFSRIHFKPDAAVRGFDG